MATRPIVRDPHGTGCSCPAASGSHGDNASRPGARGIIARLAAAALLAGIQATCAQGESTPQGTAPVQQTPDASTSEESGPQDASAPVDSGPDAVSFDAPEEDPDAEWCGGDATKAELVPLGLYLMLDRSESMLHKTASGTSKWDAVRQALGSFVSDDSTTNLHLALQYFPYLYPEAPATCTHDDDCQGRGPCVTPHICSNRYFAGEIVACKTADDCVYGGDVGECKPQGQCEGQVGLVCLPEFEMVCSDGSSECKQQPAECAGRQSCDSQAYANPEIEIAPRADVSQDIINSIGACAPTGATPTGPALQGALSYLEGWHQAHPDSQPAVVLITDGLPTDCSPTSIQDIAALAEQAAPAITTYVIGVFDDEMAQTAQQNLDQIAAAGGTSTAFIISTSQNVAQEFTQALASIRRATIACEYTIPEPTSGTLQYDKVNVEYAAGEEPRTTIPYVASSSACDDDQGGWYYDQDPQEGGTPTRIILCEQSCQMLQGHEKTVVSIRLGCPTVVIK